MEDFLRKSPYNIAYAYWVLDKCPISANPDELSVMAKYLSGMSEDNPDWWEIAPAALSIRELEVIRKQIKKEKKVKEESGQYFDVPGIEED